MSNKSIFENSEYLDKEYEHLEPFVEKIYRGFWTPGKYEQNIKKIDAPYYHYKMNDIDREVVKRCIMAVAVVEDKVKLYWNTIGVDLPQTIISDIGALIGQTEVTHRRSYHSLNQVLGIDVNEAVNHEALKGRITYLTKHLDNSDNFRGKKRLLKKLTLFTSLVERGSLFTQFYILMSFANKNKGLKTISKLQETTALEETLHYDFGIALINIIKKQHPSLWDELMVDLVSKNIKMAYDTELSLIDWFFEKGVPEHLTKEEVVNFLNDNFNTICKDLELDINFEVDGKLFEDKNSWFNTKVYVTSEPDFFDNADGTYASEEEEIDINTFKF